MFPIPIPAIITIIAAGSLSRIVVATEMGSAVAVETETVTETVEEIEIATVTATIQDLNQDLTKDRSATGKPAAAKSRTIKAFLKESAVRLAFLRLTNINGNDKLCFK